MVTTESVGILLSIAGVIVGFLALFTKEFDSNPKVKYAAGSGLLVLAAYAFAVAFRNPSPQSPGLLQPTSSSPATAGPAMTAPHSGTSIPTNIYGSTLQRVKNRQNGQGELRCGVNGTVRGFSFFQDDEGEWEGLEVAYCRALAAAIGVEEIKFEPLTPIGRFKALQPDSNGDVIVDVVFRTTSRTIARDILQGVNFGPTYYYDDQRILVHTSLGVTNTADLFKIPDLKICVLQDTTTYDNLSAHFGGKFTPITGLSLQQPFGNAEVFSTFFSQSDKGKAASRCHAISSDYSQIISNLADDTLVPPESISDYVFIDEGSKELGFEFLSPLVAEGDQQWLDIITLVTYAPMQAAELGVMQSNARDFAGDPLRGRLLYNNPSAEKLGLEINFVQKMIEEQGNYEEMFRENLFPLLRKVRSELDEQVRAADLSNNDDELYNLLAGANKLASKGKGGQITPPPLGNVQ